MCILVGAFIRIVKNVNPNNSLLGATNNTDTAVTLTSKVRFKTGHADISAFVPFSVGSALSPAWIFSVSIGGSKPSIKIHAAPLNDTTSIFTNQFTNIQGRSKGVLRAGLGIQSILIEDVGVRALWRYENTSLLRARGSELTQNNTTE